MASLHLAYNQCIIQTTRPVLLHLFKTQFQLGPVKTQPDQQQKRQAPSSITLALAESCVNAAQASSRVVEGLFLDGAIATFGYWDAHHTFSAALVLVMSAVMKPTAATATSLETLLSILRSMKTNGNIPAVDFCERLSHIQKRITSLRGASQIEMPMMDDKDGDEQRQSSGATSDFQSEGEAASMLIGNQGHVEGGMGYGSFDILGNPLIGSFLDENRAPWPDNLFREDGTMQELASEIEEQFLFQM